MKKIKISLNRVECLLLIKLTQEKSADLFMKGDAEKSIKFSDLNHKLVMEYNKYGTILD